MNQQTTQWPMTNVFNPWPVFTDGSHNVIAVKILKISPQFDGSVIITPEGDYDAIYESETFVKIFKPQAGGYLVRDSNNQDLYIDSKIFEAAFTEVSGGQGAKGDPGIGIKNITVETGPFNTDGGSGTIATFNFETDDGEKTSKEIMIYDGRSAYLLWAARPENEGKTEDEFFASLKGDKGDKGDNGDKGDKGDPGPVNGDGGEWSIYDGTFEGLESADDMSKARAHGKIGTSEFWKDGVQIGGTIAVVSVSLKKSPGIPVDKDGNPLPFTITVNRLYGSGSTIHEIYLFIYGATTHLLDLSTGQLTAFGATDGTKRNLPYTLTHSMPA